MDTLRAYSTTGVRPDADFFLWKITERYDDLGELGAALNATPLAGWLETPYSYLATTKASQYTSARRARKVVPRSSPYLVVYPFVKMRPWYALPLEERQRAMDEHIRIGAEFPSIHNHTTYSFGIDDQEFMTAFECDEPADFMHLMLTLRESEASRYTERDTPIFVGQHAADPRRARRARRHRHPRRVGLGLGRPVGRIAVGAVVSEDPVQDRVGRSRDDEHDQREADGEQPVGAVHEARVPSRLALETTRARRTRGPAGPVATGGLRNRRQRLPRRHVLLCLDARDPRLLDRGRRGRLRRRRAACDGSPCGETYIAWFSVLSVIPTANAEIELPAFGPVGMTSALE